MLLTESDPQKLDRLASASAKLTDEGFALADRPKPAYRKSPPKQERRSYRVEPIGVAP